MVAVVGGPPNVSFFKFLATENHDLSTKLVVASLVVAEDRSFRRTIIIIEATRWVSFNWVPRKSRLSRPTLDLTHDSSR